MESIASILSDFQKQYSHGVSVLRQRYGKWEPPTVAMKWKTNFDGAMFSESDQARIGVVIRNHEGQVMAALSEKIKKPASAEILEALAARRAVSLFWSWALINLCLKVTRSLLSKPSIPKIFL